MSNPITPQTQAQIDRNMAEAFWANLINPAASTGDLARALANNPLSSFPQLGVSPLITNPVFPVLGTDGSSLFYNNGSGLVQAGVSYTGGAGINVSNGAISTTLGSRFAIGSKGADYTTTSQSFVNVDGTNLVFNSLPALASGTAYKLTCSGNLELGSSTGAEVTFAISSGQGSINFQNVFLSTGAGIEAPFFVQAYILSATTAINVALQWLSVTGSTATMFNGAGLQPIMTCDLVSLF